MIRKGASEYLTSKEAALLVRAPSVCAFRVWAWRRRHLIQPLCYGNRNLYDRQELIAVLEKEARRRGRAA